MSTLNKSTVVQFWVILLQMNDYYLYFFQYSIVEQNWWLRKDILAHKKFLCLNSVDGWLVSYTLPNYN